MTLDVASNPRALIGAALLAFSTIAMGQAAAPQQPRTLAATCAACHGTDGAAVQGGAMVALAGYPKEALVAQMRAFRDGSRSATVMHQIAKGYSDSQIEVLAAYFAARSAGRP